MPVLIQVPVKIYWGTPGGSCDPTTPSDAALEVLIISGPKATPTLTHVNLDGCAARRADNNFTQPQAGGTVNNTTFAHSYSQAVTNGLIIRIVPLYTSAIVGVSGIGSNLPPQGQNVSATGSYGGTSRKITVFKGYPKLPVEFFSYLFFSH